MFLGMLDTAMKTWSPVTHVCPAENTPRRVADTSVAGACVCLHPVLSLKHCGVEDRRRQPKSMVQLSVSVCLLVGLLGKRHHLHVCVCMCVQWPLVLWLLLRCFFCFVSLFILICDSWWCFSLGLGTHILVANRGPVLKNSPEEEEEGS